MLGTSYSQTSLSLKQQWMDPMEYVIYEDDKLHDWWWIDAIWPDGEVARYGPFDHKQQAYDFKEGFIEGLKCHE